MTIHQFPVPQRRTTPLDTVLTNAFAVYTGHTGADISERQADAFNKLRAITDLRGALATYETWLLERIRRGGFSYSDEADAEQAVREAFAVLMGEGA